VAEWTSEPDGAVTGRCLVYETREKYPRVVADVPGQWDARLIAAAPELADAAETVAACVYGFAGPDHEFINVTGGELRALAAALAKARGGK
jgi:hypothetical protein